MNKLFAASSILAIATTLSTSSAFAEESLSMATAETLKMLVTNNQLVIKGVDNKGKVTYDCHCGLTVSSKQISKYVKLALVATEDKRFFHHHGFDPYAMLRALIKSLPYLLTHGRFKEGGSTITQQLCKNEVLSSRQNLLRKLDDVTCAQKLETVMTKEEIILAYLNSAYFGQINGKSIYGIELASRSFFKKHAADLNPLEASMLIGMLKNPNGLSPYRHPAAARARAKEVLGLMLTQDVINQAEIFKAKKSTKRELAFPVAFEHRYFADWVLQSIKAEKITLQVGMHIPITLKVSSQSIGEAALLKGAVKYNLPESSHQTFITMNKEGEVIAMMGDTNYGERQFNAAVDGKAPPASTFKLFIYDIAIEMVPNVEATLFDGAENGEYFRASLLAHAHGNVSLIKAFAVSTNIATLKLFRFFGAKKIIAKARKFGITAKLSSDDNLALGGSPVSLLEMTTAYNVFNANGYRTTPHGFLGVYDQNGIEILAPFFPKEKIVGSSTLTLMKRLLRAVVTMGTGELAKGVAMASGKTGTSDNNHDAWFIGFSNGLTTGVWIGAEGNESLPIAGHEAALIWARMYGGSKAK
jgi:penicillin-binding protein 1A